jgi:23S rRNA (pseudouridine1915-N3)-methyltransferase
LEKHYKLLIRIYARIEIIEVKDGKGHGNAQLHNESLRIKKALSGFQRQVLLDADGTKRNSKEFALWLASRIDGGESLAFAIGSSEGFSPSLKAEITEHISLSSMTFPHDLSRIILLEQLYRAFCILHKRPYHK